MKTILVVFGALTLATGAILLIRHFFVKRRLRMDASRKFATIEPIIKKLERAEEVSAAEISALARDPSLRFSLYHVLEAFHREHLFPESYLTYEMGAESYLVNWLEFPTELSQAPDEIRLLRKVTLASDKPFDYYVFQYRTKPPHWASDNSWMLGVAGPYGKESRPYDVPLKVFSRFTPLHSLSPEDEVQWVHKNIKSRKE